VLLGLPGSIEIDVIFPLSVQLAEHENPAIGLASGVHLNCVSPHIQDIKIEPGINFQEDAKSMHS
jgi:hypothetical protein